MLMTFSGSILFLGYWCWQKLCGHMLTQNIKYKALIIVLIVYVMPWMWIKGIYNKILELIIPAETAGRELAVNFARIETGVGEIYRTQDYQWLMLVTNIWVFGAVIFLFAKMVKYFRTKHYLLSVSERCRDSKTEELVVRIQQKFRYRRRIEVYETAGENITFTIGIVRPIIFLQKQYTESELEWILSHEMVHIFRRDLMVKLLLEFVCCLHWFNPVIYALKGHLETVCETSCDERVIHGRTEEECTEYARLIVKNMGAVKKKILFGSALSNDNYKKAAGRVKVVMNKRKIRRWEKVVAGSLFAVMVFASSLTAFAYPNVYQMEEFTETESEAMDAGDTFWVCDEDVNGFDFSADVIIYDEQFIDEEGNIYPANTNNARVICFNHNIVSGYLQFHVKDDNGGCTVTIYKSTRCTKCNTIWLGDLVSTHIYVTCPH